MFSTWFDDKVWWPLGRPVGTTTYPGMMVTASGIFDALQEWGIDTSLNDVCVMLPAYLGALSTLFTYVHVPSEPRALGAPCRHPSHPRVVTIGLPTRRGHT